MIEIEIADEGSFLLIVGQFPIERILRYNRNDFRIVDSNAISDFLTYGRLSGRRTATDAYQECLVYWQY
uniref:Uncharacterized protein n=1 Tax=Romanomermis culicivorax TaxID=13658 RepID=A0A915JVW0_ROMCU